MADQATFDGRFDAASADTNVPELIEGVVGVKPEFVEDYDLHLMTDDDRLQVRVESNVAPAFMVNRMANQMAHSKFPPIVVTADDKMDDGNTRRRAYRKREIRFVPAWRIPISYDESDEETQNKLVFLGRLLNNSNGQPLGRTEQRLMARDAIELGLSNAQTVGTVGLSPNIVRAVRREMRGESVVTRVGLPKETLASSQKGALGEFEHVHDEPIKALVELARDANLSVTDIKHLGVDVAQASSDTAAAAVVEAERKALNDRIADVAAGRVGKPPAAKLLRQRLGFITSRDAEQMIERNDANMRAHLEAVEAAIETLTEVARLQSEECERAGV